MSLSHLSEDELYRKLEPYVMSESKLERYGYPIKDFDSTGSVMKKKPLGKTLNRSFESSYVCKRCKVRYPVGSDGVQLPSCGECRSHLGTVYYHQLNGLYWCCKQRSNAPGCYVNRYHVHEAELEAENYYGFVETQSRPLVGRKIFAVDCEMCFTPVGLELTQVIVLDYKKDVVYETLVKPLNKILDYNTRFSGIREGDLEGVRTTIHDVQRELMKLFSSETILIGHGLDSDMDELKIFHKRFIDTSELFPHHKGFPYKRALRYLVEQYLNKKIQGDSGHNAEEDAKSAFDLVTFIAARGRGPRSQFLV